jgi:hypothetical protein
VLIQELLSVKFGIAANTMKPTPMDTIQMLLETRYVRPIAAGTSAVVFLVDVSLRVPGFVMFTVWASEQFLRRFNSIGLMLQLLWYSRFIVFLVVIRGVLTVSVTRRTF